jgi:transcriptional regulator with XRE-family HTH domain
MSVTVSAFRLFTSAPTYIYHAQVKPLSKSAGPPSGHPSMTSRKRDRRVAGAVTQARRPYGHEVTETANARKIAFATFVRRALDEARATRAWSGTEVSRRTGVSRQTINRWVRGDWASDPEAERVVAFCEGLGLDPAVAFAALGWDRTASRRTRSAPPPMDPDVEALLRRLVDPDVSDAEKFHIRETIRYLAYRPTLPLDVRKRGDAAS